MIHWCNDESMMLMSAIPFIGYYFRKLHIWYHTKIKHRCHTKHCDSTHAEHSDDSSENMTRCSKCPNTAVWWYMPSDRAREAHYCDDCVPRGCSCNEDPETGIEYRDGQGRLLPCCEYDYVVDEE